jgi:spore maturation protein CgeB
MYEALQRSQLTFNMHTDLVTGTVGNMRMFDATGVGTCMLVEHGTNIGDLFIPDQEVVTYSSLGECVEKARWLLNRPAEREAIARAGQRRTLSEHTFGNRCRQTHELIAAKL